MSPSTVFGNWDAKKAEVLLGVFGYEQVSRVCPSPSYLEMFDCIDMASDRN